MSINEANFTSDILNNSDMLLHRIRILKTGLYNVGKYISIETPEEIHYYERLAKPGTELILERDYSDVESKPWRIKVLSPFDHRLLGYVTYYKSETAARLMDEGFRVIAIVNDSLPIHDNDEQTVDLEHHSNEGWSVSQRFGNDHTVCNLPFALYLEE